MRFLFSLIICICVYICNVSSFAKADENSKTVSFNEEIRPILSDNCFACHGTDSVHREADLRLDIAEGAASDLGGHSAIVPGNLEQSEAWKRITSTDADIVMPPPTSHKKPLSKDQQELIRRWIEQGAPYQRHWAFEPILKPELPTATAGAGDHPIDRFVGAKLESRGLKFSKEASPEILLRRVTLGLTGLPPTLRHIDDYTKRVGQQTDVDQAYEEVVDRLLDSPQYGEHIARYWLDAVRYADTHGMHYDNERTIWPYRDWVVKAFNENLPFDQFTIQQLAGDLLPNPTQSQLIASGYNRALITTNEGGSIEEEVLAQYTGDRASTTAGVWLGLTAGCAACHDHKFDPLTQKEYYELGAFFRGLSDKVWDANTKLPGPIVLVTNEQQQKRLDSIAAELPTRRTALAEQAEAIQKMIPAPKRGATSYEVVWAEDGDMPTPKSLDSSGMAGEWVGGKDVPLVGGQRALRLEGKVDRFVAFGAGDITLFARKGSKVFANVCVDVTNAPTGISVELVSLANKKRMVWGDAKAFGDEIVKTAIVAGPLPLAGSYLRLEFDPAVLGVGSEDELTGIRITQNGGVSWWDRLGMVFATSEADKDPLLSVTAWAKLMSVEKRRYLGDYPLEITYLIRQPDYFTTDEQKKVLADYHRDFIYGPTRGVLEPLHHSARRLLAEQVYWEKTIPGTLISKELDKPREAFVLLRGQYDKHGESVLPGTPAFLPELKLNDGTQGERASRLDLARWLVRKDNPLTARVTVNRVWQQLFGVGLVQTPGDFGTQGSPPSHLALLDWLAEDFMSHGWDMKRLVKLMVTSKAYRQDSLITPALQEVDPSNRLLARGPRYRLDAEVLRDHALAISGLMQTNIGGPPVRPYQPDGLWKAVSRSDSNTYEYTADTGSSLYRRSLYNFWKRTAPPPALITFDAPSRESSCLRRDRTNTPLQALALMNDTQQFEAARALAEQVFKTSGDDSTRLELAFRMVTARFPTDAERKLLATALSKQRSHFTTKIEDAKNVLRIGDSKATEEIPSPEFAAWTLVMSLLLNLDETVSLN